MSSTHTGRPTAAWGPSPEAPPVPRHAPDVQDVPAGPVPRPGSGEPGQPFARRLWRGRPEDPPGARPAFL
ncbi:hypothetical protein AB0D38_32410, partial [Streptomyces sp. NPDC048279]